MFLGNPKVFLRQMFFTRENFTLVELLIVIAIIAMLTAVLLPALNRAKDASRGLVCLNNLKQTGVAQMAYAEDHQGWIVSRSIGYSAGSDKWYHLLAGTWRNPRGINYGVTFDGRGSGVPTGTFACPSEQTQWGSYSDTPPKFNHTHYGENKFLGGYISGGTVYFLPQKISVILQASVAVFAVDKNRRSSEGVSGVFDLAFRHGARDPRPVVNYLDSYVSLPLTAFTGRANVLYMDGHAAAHRADYLRSQKDEKGTTSESSFLTAGIRQ